MRSDDTADRLWTSTDVAEYCGVPPHTLDNWAWRRIGPAFIKVGKHRRYRVSDVQSWLNANRHGGDAA